MTDATQDRAASDRISEVVALHRPVAVYALFSGGHDSLAATSIAMQHPATTGVLHINTGIGIEETREFVRDTCWLQDWPLRELHPPEGTSYDELVLKFGFPGPNGHGVMYRRLKERALRQVTREAKQHMSDRVVFITGIRAQESVRRMKSVDGSWDREGSRVWAAPLYDWTKQDVNSYLATAGLQRNRVSDLLHLSGECLCGAFAKPGERGELEQWFPETAARIHELEARCGAKHNYPRETWGWGAWANGSAHPDWESLFDPGPLCSSCAYRAQVAT